MVIDFETIDWDTCQLREKIIDEDGVEMPSPSPKWEKRLNELLESKLEFQHEAGVFEMRCEQIKALGFYRLADSDAVEILMGIPHNKTESGTERIKYGDYMYFHTTDEVKTEDGWGVDDPTSYLHMAKQGSWFLPPFAPQELWRVEPIFDLRKLDVVIPPGVVATMNRLKKGKIFNSYCVLKSSNGCCLLRGNIYEIQPKPGSSHEHARRSEHYFIAKW